MTIRAAGALMTAQQGVVGLGMIERRFTHAPDVRIPPEMIGMTASALTVGGQGISTMKSLALSQVGRNLLMPVQTELSLRIFSEWLLTG